MKWTIRCVGAAAVALLATASGLGCASSAVGAAEPGGSPSESAPLAKGGAQLWAESCLRCHNSRAPNEYSDAQWDVVMLHMRVRANLTANEHEKILEFLKAGN